MITKVRVPSVRDFESVLRSKTLTVPQLRALQALYNFPGHSATAPQLADVLGYKGFGGANSVMGGAGRRIAEKLGVNPPWANNQRQNWFSIVANAKGTDIGCLWIMHPALINALEKSNLVAPPVGDKVNTYLFITKPEFKPEKIRKGKDGWWSCSKATKVGDHVLIYVAGKGISHEWRAVSNAERNEQWGYVCNVKYVGTFDPPITLQEIRTEFPKEAWSPPHQSFRGYKSIYISSRVLAKIRAMRRMGVRSLQDAEQEFVEKVVKSLKLSSYQRRERLSSAQRQPARSEQAVRECGIPVFFI